MPNRRMTKEKEQLLISERERVQNHFNKWCAEHKINRVDYSQFIGNERRVVVGSLLLEKHPYRLFFRIKRIGATEKEDYYITGFRCALNTHDLYQFMRYFGLGYKCSKEDRDKPYQNENK